MAPSTMRRRSSIVRTFQFDADAVGIVTSGVHLVEVVIGETDGFDPSSTTQPTRDEDRLHAGGVAFPVNVRVEQVSGLCNQPPAQSRRR